MPLQIRRVTSHDVPICAAIEARCFSPSEAASAAQIAMRAQLYPAGFLVAERDGLVVGFTNSAASHMDDLADEALKDMVAHDPTGATLIVFSLAVHPEAQRQGIARALLTALIDQARSSGKRNALLLCKANLVAYYQQLGFANDGRSASTHGGAAWHQMRLAL